LFEKFPTATESFFARAMFEEHYNKDYKSALEFYNRGLVNLKDSYFDEASYLKDIDRVRKLMGKN
jgi:hypothetical protein